MKKKITIKDLPAGKKARNVKGGLGTLALKYDSAIKLNTVSLDGIKLDSSTLASKW
jgi:hypothetical protein